MLPAPSSSARLLRAVVIGLLAAACGYPWWHDVSPWASAAFFVAGAALADMPAAAVQMPPLAHFGILIAALQYGLAPLASHYYSAESEYRINDFTRYFAYAGPALLAVALGWTVCFLGLKPRAETEPRTHYDPRLLGELDLLLWGGLAVGYLGRNYSGGGLAFVLVLLSNLRFLGVIGWLILAPPGWKWRVLVVLGLEVVSANQSGMFHDVVLWGLSLVGIYVFSRRLRGAVLLSWVLGLFLCVFFLQDAKQQIRRATWYGSNEVTIFGYPMSLDSWTRPLVSALCVADSASKLVTGGYTDESIADIIDRFNQGWIVDAVQHQVPANTPYAGGETITRALEASLLPRVLAPNKLIAGGKDNMERFAGRTLTEDTSMNLGFAGEMYANFGYRGGIIGCGIYALCLGLLFRWVALRARRSPLWWAIAAYAGHWALKAETDVGSVLNYVVKAGVVAAAVVWAMPALKSELRGPEPARAAKRRERRSEIGDRRSEGKQPGRASVPASPNMGRGEGRGQSGGAKAETLTN